MRPIPFHNRTRLFTLVIKPSPVAHNLPLRILYTVANNLGLSAHRAFSFGPSSRLILTSQYPKLSLTDSCKGKTRGILSQSPWSVLTLTLSLCMIV